MLVSSLVEFASSGEVPACMRGQGKIRKKLVDIRMYVCTYLPPYSRHNTVRQNKEMMAVVVIILGRVLSLVTRLNSFKVCVQIFPLVRWFLSIYGARGWEVHS